MRKIVVPVLLVVFLVGCTRDATTEVFGRDQAELMKELDLNGDGVITREEIKQSVWDKNKDGELDEGEVAAATEPNALVQLAVGAVSAFFPMAGVLYTRAQRDRKHIRAIVGGVEDIVKLKGDDGKFSKEDLYEAIRLSSKKRTDAVALSKLVSDIKAEIRAEV